MGPNSFAWPTWQPSDSKELDRLGTQAIARCSPSNAAADLSVALGETIKEGIPHLFGAALKGLGSMSGKERRKALASEHLNYEFGWKPFVNDIRKGAKAVADADAIWQQYERDSGKLVRRRYEFPVETRSKVTTYATGISPWVSPSSSAFLNFSALNQGQVLRTEEFRRRRWFSGAFTYFVPEANQGLRNGLARAVIQARKVYGISLTPDTVWNLSPWSWLIDWRLNIGDLLSNWTDWAIDNQVLVYGYMMEHTFQKYTYTYDGPTGLFGFEDGRPAEISFITETKLRRRATPYGFGVDMSGLSARQLAILASLGISREK